MIEASTPFARLRQSFPGAAKAVYLDVAARGLISCEVRAALDAHLDSRMEGGDKTAMLETAELARRRFAALVRAETDEIALVKNVSDGLNAVATAIAWKRGDNLVLCEEVEHPSNVFVWHNISEAHGVEVRRVAAKGGAIDPQRLMDAADEHTRLVTAASVTFAPGFRTDLRAIGDFCRERGIFFLVDGAQSVGVLETDLATFPIDGLAVATQKGLLGLYGMGFLFVRRAWAEQMRPAYLSRFGVDLGAAHEASGSSGGYCLNRGARRFDVGNFNYVGCVAAATSIGQLLDVGSAAIERYVLGLSTTFTERLRELDLPLCEAPSSDRRSHIVSLARDLSGQHDATDDSDLQSLFAFLVRNGVRLSIRRGALRLSFHAYNDEADVARVAELIRAWRASGQFGRDRSPFALS